jgi:Fe-S cluster assembly protein SufD
MTTLTQNNIADQIIAQHPHSEKFQEYRANSLVTLKRLGLPERKSEEYKFTLINKKIEQSLSSFRPAQLIDLADINIRQFVHEGFDGDLLVFNNGFLDEKASNIHQKNYTIEFLDEKNPKNFGQIAKLEKDPFVALNGVCFQNSVSIEIGKNEKVEKPIFLLFLNKANNGTVISPRIYIEVEENAEVGFLENTISLDELGYFNNVVTEINVAQNAHVHYTRLQNENKKAIVINNFETDIHRDATFTSSVVSLSGDMVRNNLTLNLLDTGCEGNMYGLYLLNGKTHVDNHTNVDHTKPHAQSNELYKGILADSSRGVFNGKIFVRQDAQKTNAFQQNNNILLSEDATVNTKPQLEIWADDVKCSHGCTTGQLDEEALFYLQARGLGKEQAKGLLLYAFAGEVLDFIQDEKFRDFIIDLVQERLGGSYQ